MIAQRNKTTENVVHYIASQLNLGPAGFNNRTAGTATSRFVVDRLPLKPKGYTAEQLAWALANVAYPEARMMLVMNADLVKVKR